MRRLGVAVLCGDELWHWLPRADQHAVDETCRRLAHEDGKMFHTSGWRTTCEIAVTVSRWRPARPDMVTCLRCLARDLRIWSW